MRAFTHTETTVRNMLSHMITTRRLTHADAVRIYSRDFRDVSAIIANWRHHNATNEAITAAIDRRMLAAQQHRTQASLIVQNLGGQCDRARTAVTRANRDLVIAELYRAVWRGMQQDAASYRNN